MNDAIVINVQHKQLKAVLVLFVVFLVVFLEGGLPQSFVVKTKLPRKLRSDLFNTLFIYLLDFIFAGVM